MTLDLSQPTVLAISKSVSSGCLSLSLRMATAAPVLRLSLRLMLAGTLAVFGDAAGWTNSQHSHFWHGPLSGWSVRGCVQVAHGVVRA